MHCGAVYVNVMSYCSFWESSVLLQDVSSIGCYLWDITLLFAQQQDNRELTRQISLLQVSNPPSHMMSHTLHDVIMDRIMIFKLQTHVRIAHICPRAAVCATRQ